MPATALTTASKLAPSTGANPDSSSIAATHHSFLAADYIYTCNSGCIDFSKKIPACIGGYRNSPSQGPWGEVLDISSIANAVNLTGNVMSLFVNNDNINHALHDDLWTGLAWLDMLRQEMVIADNMNVIIHADKSPWASEFLRLCNVTFNWRAQDFRTLSSPNNVTSLTVCAQGGVMFMNGFLRKISEFGISRLKSMQKELRQVALQNVNGHINSKEDGRKEHIVIYTRLDSDWRNLLQVEDLVRLFDSDKYNVSVVSSMPNDFYKQVKIFAEADLLIAPNGGWSPNVLWMHDDACLVEVHLYKTDSWIQMFGLHNVFKSSHFITVTGDYHDPNKARVRRKYRVGGDDNILGSLLAPDIEKTLRKNTQSPCNRFLT